jgi:hypothetical protein
MLWGHKYMSIPMTKISYETVRLDTQQSTLLNNTLKSICPQDHLYVRIHNTVADATRVNNPKVNSTIEYNHACMRRP